MVTSTTKTHYIAELACGMRVSDLFVLHSVDVRNSVRSGAYALYTLSDRTGSMRAIQFDVGVGGVLPSVGSVVAVSGLVERQGSGKRIKVTNLVMAQSYDSTDFLPVSSRPLAEMRAEFKALLESVGDAQLRAVVVSVFRKGDTWERFCRAPAAEGGAGACIGGALEKVLRVANLVEVLAENHAELNRDVLIAGVLLRFVGAVDAWSMDTSVIPTARGAALGVRMLSLYRLRDASVYVRRDKREKLEQLVLGEPTGACPEVALLNLCEKLTAQAECCSQGVGALSKRPQVASGKTRRAIGNRPYGLPAISCCA